MQPSASPMVSATPCNLKARQAKESAAANPSHFDPHNQVYFVPRSAVKLVSLGVLTTLGYTVYTDKTRSIFIADLKGTILCSCPIQSNNTWIFPSFFMTGKVPPTTADPTRNSGKLHPKFWYALLASFTTLTSMSPVSHRHLSTSVNVSSLIFNYSLPYLLEAIHKHSSPLVIALDSFPSWVPNIKTGMISCPVYNNSSLLTTLDVIQLLLSVLTLRLSASLLLLLSVCSMLISLTRLLMLTVTKLSAPSNRSIKKQQPSSSHSRSSYPSSSSFTSRSTVLTVSILRPHPLSTLIPFPMSLHRVKPEFNSDPSKALPLVQCV
jgi:hypothetical protein